MLNRHDGLEVRASIKLRKLAGKVAHLEPIRIYSEDFARPEKEEDFTSIFSGSSLALYSISFPNAECDAIYNAFAEARNEARDGRSYSRLLPKPQARESRCAYVGSSENLVKRMKEHFGFGHKATYALHMNRWANDLGPVRIEVREYQQKTEKTLILILEDAWSDELIPLFGRRGSL